MAGATNTIRNNQQMPDPFLSENDKYANGGKWFKDNLEYISSFYNKQGDTGGVFYRGNGALDRTNTLTPIQNMLQYYSYFKGKQVNRDYGFAELDEFQQPLAVPYIKGMKINELINFMMGAAKKIINNINVTAKSISEGATNRYTEKIAEGTVAFALKPFFDKIEKETGIKVSPFGGAENEFQIPQDIEDYLQKTPQDQLEIECTKIAYDILYRNDYKETFYELIKDALIGGLAACHIEVVNGRVIFKPIRPYYVIWDNSRDNQFLRYQKYQGYVEFLTAPQIIAKFDLTDEQEAKVKEAQTTAPKWLSTILNTMMPFGTWSEEYGVPIPVVHGYWKGIKDTRTKKGKKKDRFGQEHIYELRDLNDDGTPNLKNLKKKGDYSLEVIYKGVLIGGDILCNYGENTNNYEDPLNPSNLEFPIKMWVPEMTLGEPISLVRKMHQHSDRRDYLENKLTELMNLALGKVTIIQGDALGDKTVAELYNDFKRYRTSVVQGYAKGDGDPAEMKRLQDSYAEIDMTLDPMASQFIALKQQEDDIINSTINANKISLGQQSTYVGLGTQRGNVALQTQGTLNYFDGAAQFLTQILQHGVNVDKNIRFIQETEDMPPIIGRMGRETLKLNKDYALEDIGIWLQIDDIISDESRSRIIQYMQAWSQNPEYGISPEDILKIERSKTFTEAINVAYASVARGKIAVQKQMEMAQQMNQIQMEQGMQMEAQKQQNEDAKFMAKLENEKIIEKMGNDTAVATTLIKERGKNSAAVVG